MRMIAMTVLSFVLLGSSVSAKEPLDPSCKGEIRAGTPSGYESSGTFESFAEAFINDLKKDNVLRFLHVVRRTIERRKPMQMLRARIGHDCRYKAMLTWGEPIAENRADVVSITGKIEDYPEGEAIFRMETSRRIMALRSLK